MDTSCSVRLLPFERALLAAVAHLEDRGETVIYGSLLARVLPREHHSDTFLRSGWLYRALGRLVALGLLDSWIEDATTVRHHVGHRPRRFYRLTAAGRSVLGRAP